MTEIAEHKRSSFATMDRTKQREIASKGGRAAHERGTAHEWTRDEAREAGRKGGLVSRGGRGREHSADGRRVTPPRNTDGTTDTTES